MNGWKGLFITFEGTEGSGKTTQVELFCRYLDERGISHIRTRDPGGTPIGEAVRKILLDRENTNMRPETELLLYLSSRYQLFHQVILPALEQGRIVVCDRFADSTVAYQGYGRGIDLEWIRLMHHQILGDKKPDLTILFDCPVKEGLERTKHRMSTQGEHCREDRFEQEAVSFHQRVRTGYLKIAEQEPHRVIKVNGRNSPEDLHREILSVISKRCPNPCLLGKL
ncbi:MAG: dTMP kinase [Deltaproteobacteria bacterium]|nr:dTMP kinase [Deltaproteobacteria bacterium]MBW2307510.1 dTMP kinase [Deltaproteobacteria bacterium]